MVKSTHNAQVSYWNNGLYDYLITYMYLGTTCTVSTVQVCTICTIMYRYISMYIHFVLADTLYVMIDT